MLRGEWGRGMQSPPGRPYRDHSAFLVPLYLSCRQQREQLEDGNTRWAALLILEIPRQIFPFPPFISLLLYWHSGVWFWFFNFFFLFLRLFTRGLASFNVTKGSGLKWWESASPEPSGITEKNECIQKMSEIPSMTFRAGFLPCTIPLT